MMEKRLTERNDRKSLSKSKLKQQTCKRSKYDNEKSELMKNDQLNKCQPSDNDPASSKPKYNFSDDSSDDEKDVINKPISPDRNEGELKWQGKSVHLKDMKVNLKRLHDNNKLNSTDDTTKSSDFYTCTSSPSSQPKEYITRNKVKLDSSSSKEQRCGIGRGGRSRYLPESDEENQARTKDAQEHVSNGDKFVNEYIESSPFFDGDNEGNISPTYGDSSIEQDNIVNAVQNKNGGKIMSEESEAFFWDWILKKE